MSLSKGIKMVGLKMKAPAEEGALINQIAERAAEVAKKHKINYDKLWANMDLTTTHLNGCPLRLQELLKADELNFTHDVFGIRNHLDRNTGRLMRQFLPRYAAKQ